MTTPDKIEQWLVGAGWRTEQAVSARLREWIAPNDVDSVLVPHDPEARDYARLLSFAMSELAASVGQGLTEFTALLDSMLVDRILIHAEPLRKANAFDLDAVIKLMSATRSGLRDAASSVVEPRLSYGPNRARRVKEYVEALAVGYSFAGSYAFPIYAPLDLVQEEDDDGQQSIPLETFERRSTIQFARSLRLLAVTSADAMRTGDLSVFDPAYASGVSANLCSSVAAMFADSYFEGVSVELELSSKIEASEEPLVRVDSRIEPVLREASDRLKALTEQPARMSVTGEVAELLRDYESSGGAVVVRTLIDGNRRSIQLALTPEQYQVAIRAHDAKLPVIAMGTLEVRGNRRWLRPVDRFMRVDQLELD